MASLALEVEHGIDHVLEHPRAGDQPLLGHMPDQHHDKAAPLRQPDQLLRGAAHLANGSGRAVERVEIHRLNRVDHDKVGRAAVIEGGDDIADTARRGEPDRAIGDAEPVGAQPNLVDRLLAGDVSGSGPAGRERGRRLQQDRRFADARIAADEDRRAGNQASAADPVEFGNPGQQARRPSALAAQGNKIDGAAATPSCAGLRQALRRRGARQFLDHAVPGSASLAPAGPFRRNGAALLAGIAELELGHWLGRFSHAARTSIRIGPSARPWTN